MLTVCLLLVFLTFSSACLPSLPSRLHTAPTANLTFTPATCSIVVPPHTTFHLLLKSNPTTGYTWSLHPSSSASGFTVTACTYKQHVHALGMVGVGGEEVWEVEAGGLAGEWALALQYNREWEGDKKEADVVWTVRVTRPAADQCHFSLAGLTATD